MKFTASSTLLAGAALLSAMSAVSASGIVQACAKPLLVKPGGIVTVTMNFVVDDIPPPGRRLESARRLATTDIIAGLSTNPDPLILSALNKNNDTKNHTKNKSDKHPGDDEITIRSVKIFPNTWKPKAKANITEDGDGETAIWTLPTDDLVLNKEYKITYKVRVGKGVDSGDTIELPIFFDGPDMDLDDIGSLFVQVK